MSTRAGTNAYAAVGLGASSGRVMVGRVGPGKLLLAEAHRFPNRPVRLPSELYWDLLSLYAGVLGGLRAAGRMAPLTSVGIDSWAVDHGLLDADGALLGNPVHYRDARTEGVAVQVWARVPTLEMYARTGLRYAPFNTLYQLVAARDGTQLKAARRLLLIPDLLAYWLTGTRGTELTNASTTQLLDPRPRTWSTDLAEQLGIDLNLFPPLRHPGDPAGRLLPAVLEETGLYDPVLLTTVASHDTASAVAAVPASAGERFAYVCTGTWSLAGLELDAPVLTEASRRANFTSELGPGLHLNCPRMLSGAMSITGWRVHFTRQEQEWPRGAKALMREFSALFADLDQRLDDWGVPEGRPFQISPKGESDGGVAVNIIEC